MKTQQSRSLEITTMLYPYVVYSSHRKRIRIELHKALRTTFPRAFLMEMITCHTNLKYPAGIQAAAGWCHQDRSTVKNTSLSILRKYAPLRHEATAVGGTKRGRLTSGSTRSVCAALRKVYTQKQQWSITLFHTEETLSSSGMSLTGRPSASRATTGRQGTRMRHQPTITEEELS